MPQDRKRIRAALRVRELAFISGCLLTTGIFAGPASAIDIRLAPGDGLILNRANDQGMFDVVLHTVGVATGSDETLALGGLRIEVLRGGTPILVKYVTSARMVEETKGLTGESARPFLAPQLLAANGVSQFFGREVSPAASATIGPEQFLLTTRHHFSLDAPADEIRVVAEGSGSTVSASIPVRPYESRISYIMPLDGAWKLHSLPSISSHHRLNPPTEFAVDFFKTDADGRTIVGDPLPPTNALGYGTPVKAAADGEVVFVISDDVQDRAAFMPQPGEDPRAAGARIGAFNMQRMAKDLRRGAGGNIVTLRHDAGGAAEFSSYGHLKAGSVAVTLGERVKQGQVIGEVGDTGDSPAVHLHFQINAGPDAFMSKSLPAQFSDLRYLGSSRDPARFVTNGK